MFSITLTYIYIYYNDNTQQKKVTTLLKHGFLSNTKNSILNVIISNVIRDCIEKQMKELHNRRY